MNRVKYPSQRVIHREIDSILDQSGIFEHTDQMDTTYVAFKPVKSKKSIVYTTVSIGVAAALALVIINLSSVSSIFHKSSLNPQASISSGETDVISSINLNNNIRIDMESGISTITCDNEEQDKVDFNYMIPDVYYNDKVESIVNDLYISRINDIQNEVYNEYNKYSEAQQKKQLIQKPVNVEFSSENAPYISDFNQDVVSFVDTYTYTTQSGDRNIITKTMTGHNFDLKSGKELKLEDIFTNYDQGFSELQAYINQSLNNAANNNSDSDRIVKKLSAEHVIMNGNWYFGNMGIVFCCNQMYQKNINYDDNKYTNISAGTILVPYKVLSSLKGEYKN